jgi:hypothetical protein
MDELFKGRHFDREIIVLCVRWYLRYKLSFRDLVERHCHAATDLQSSWSPGSQWDGEDQLRWIPLPAGDH